MSNVATGKKEVFRKLRGHGRAFLEVLRKGI